MSLLTKLQANDKELGVTKDHDVAAEDFKAYIETQVNEMRAVLVRLRVDILLNKEIPVEGNLETEGRDKKIKELSNDARQFVESIDVMRKLHDEL